MQKKSLLVLFIFCLYFFEGYVYSACSAGGQAACESCTGKNESCAYTYVNAPSWPGNCDQVGWGTYGCGSGCKNYTVDDDGDPLTSEIPKHKYWSKDCWYTWDLCCKDPVYRAQKSSELKDMPEKKTLPFHVTFTSHSATCPASGLCSGPGMSNVQVRCCKRCCEACACDEPDPLKMGNWHCIDEDPIYWDFGAGATYSVSTSYWEDTLPTSGNCGTTYTLPTGAFKCKRWLATWNELGCKDLGGELTSWTHACTPHEDTDWGSEQDGTCP